MIYLARPADPGSDSPILRTALPLTEVNADLAGLMRTLTAAAVVSLLLTIAGIAWLSQRVSTTVTGSPEAPSVSPPAT